MTYPWAMAKPGPQKSVKGMRLRVSDSGRFFVDQNGTPFFYLGDTVWTLFKRFEMDEVEEYLQNRSAKGFNVVQCYLLRGLKATNRQGETTLVGRDPTKLNEGFFRNVDRIVRRANELGLVMGICISYGEHVIHSRLDEQIFNAENASAFGRIVGARYKNDTVIWLLGGDRNPSEATGVWGAMGNGLKEGSAGAHLVSFHGPGGVSSSTWFHQEPWLDFNTIQSGHRWAIPNYAFVHGDYVRQPTKPTLDMEARYENHPDGPNIERRMDAHQEREAAYWAVFAGAAGHGYGCNDMWQLYNPERMPSEIDMSYFPSWQRLMGNTHWRKAMDFQGAVGMGHLRRLVEERPWYKAAPDYSVLASPQREFEDHVEALRARDGSFVLAYLPFGGSVSINLERLGGSEVRAQWYDPRLGTWREIGRFARARDREFTAPTSGDQEDWVLVLDAV